jgi:hypothetical protein
MDPANPGATKLVFWDIAADRFAAQLLMDSPSGSGRTAPHLGNIKSLPTTLLESDRARPI